MEEISLVITGNLDLEKQTKSMMWYDCEIEVAKQKNINLNDYALKNVIFGLRMRGSNLHKGIELEGSAIDAYELKLIKIK